MEIKTTKQFHQETEDSFEGEDEYLNKKWVGVDDVMEWITALRKSNNMWRYPVDECFGRLEEEIAGKSKDVK